MTKPFSFANLVGGRSKPRAEADPEMEDEAPTEPAEDEVEDAPAEDEAEDEAPADDAARRAVLAERARVAGILSAAGPESVALAATLATTTDLTVDQAKAVLAAAPKAGGSLASAMKGRSGAIAPSAASEAAAGDLPPELKAAQARRLPKER